MAFGKTYLVGAKGLFQVYDHNTNMWTDQGPVVGAGSGLLDVKTSQLPNFPDYAILCGDGYIGYTTNGGQTVNSVTAPVGTIIGKAYQISIPESVAMQNPGVYIAGTGIGAFPSVIKSVDAGLTYTLEITGLNSTFGIGAASIYFKDVNTGILGHGGAIAKTTDGADNWTYLNGGAVLAAGEIVSGLIMSDDEQIIVAATDKKVYRSTNGGTSFSVVYTWSSSEYYGITQKFTTLSGYHPNYLFDSTSSLWISAGNGPMIHSADMGVTWSEVFPALPLGSNQRRIQGSSFYSATEGFFTYDSAIDNLGLVYKATDAATTIVNTSSLDYYNDGPGFSLWTTQVTPGCGCPPGFILDPISQTCRQSYFTCPDGFTWNPETEECEGAEVPCELDLVIAIDRSSSISTAEMVLYKTFIRDIIDAVQDTAGGNARITDGTVRVGIVYWGQSSPLVSAESGSGTNLSLQVGAVSTTANSVWGPAPTQGSLKAKISTMAAVGPGNGGAYVGQGTNYFAGLAAAYGMLAPGATNARPSAKKKILWITDGWPNTSNPPVTINGVTQPTNVQDGWCTPGATGYSATYGIPGVAGSSAPVNVCHMPTNLATQPNTSPYIAAKRLMHTQAMDLAQAIKTGTGLNTTVPASITAIIVGTPEERAITRGALIGPVATAGGPPLSGPGNYCQFNVNDYFFPNPTPGTALPYWDSSYQIDSPPGSGNWLRFPSNNAAGTPDYFETEFNFNPAIIDGIKTSLLCTITEPPMICPDPCVLNTVTGVCDCISSDLFVPCCYTLTNCDTGLVEYTVNTFGLANDYLNALQGQILKITGLDECLYVNITFECTNSTEISIDAVEEAFETCEDCKEYIASPPCYLLTNCNNTDIILRTTQNLSIFSGKVVELNDYPGLCWTVLKTSNCPGPFTTVGVVESYDDCECCFQYQCK
jgi:hypothetical protein